MTSISCDEIASAMKEKESWYNGGARYWQDVDASVNGMLGGFESISKRDAKSSLSFLKQLKDGNIIKIPFHRALDCGAGIGRVAKETLVKVFDTVDLVEQNGDFLKQTQLYMGDAFVKIGNLYAEGLQDFTPQTSHYSVIWVQWVTGYLTDDDFLLFLLRCKEGLERGGLICIKDNVASVERILDKDDSSVTRTNADILEITERSGLKLEMCLPQKHFPKELFGVNMYAFSVL